MLIFWLPHSRWQGAKQPHNIRQGLTICRVIKESWRDAAESLGPSFGTFIPVSPLIANSVSHMDSREKTTVIDHIRRGAARQHLDYVIAYEVSHKTKSSTFGTGILI